jgi:hypothetical protein
MEVREVDNNNEIAGGVTTANLPQAAKNFRRSSMAAASCLIESDICVLLANNNRIYKHINSIKFSQVASQREKLAM